MIYLSSISANFIRLAHLAVIVFVLGGSLVPSPLIWKVHVIFIPLMLLQWRFNQDVCVLTTLEQQLSQKAGKNVDFEDNQFVAHLITRCTGTAPSRRLLVAITWGLPLLSMSISAGRLMGLPS